MKIAMANDHAGTALKNQIKAYLESQGHEVKDFGTYDEEGCDLSDFVYPAALSVAKGECERGIFVDGVGYGATVPRTHRLERPLHRRKNYRLRDCNGNCQNVDEDRAAHRRKISSPRQESLRHQRQTLRPRQIKSSRFG